MCTRDESLTVNLPNNFLTMDFFKDNSSLKTLSFIQSSINYKASKKLNFYWVISRAHLGILLSFGNQNYVSLSKVYKK